MGDDEQTPDEAVEYPDDGPEVGQLDDEQPFADEGAEVHAATTAIWPGGLFETGDLRYWSQAWTHGHVYVEKTAKRGGTYGARFAVANTDLKPTSNPRAQIQAGPGGGVPPCEEGNDCYIGISVKFDQNMPTIAQWMSWFQVYGVAPSYPRGTSPALCFQVQGYGGKQVVAWNNLNTGNKWKVPLVKGVWHDLVLHVIFSKDPSKGLVELWWDGSKQTLSNGQKLVRTYTMFPGQNPGSGYWILCAYHAVNNPTSVATLFLDSFRVGSSFAAADPAQDGPRV